MQDQDDRQLIISYLQGNEQSLEILIAKYLKIIYGFIYGYVNDQAIAQDITQETFIKVWKNIQKFDKEKKFKSWIFAIAKNTALDYLKRKNAIPFSVFENEEGKNAFLESLADNSLLQNKMAERLDTKDVIALAMKRLSFKYRRVLSLYYNKHFNFREISEILGESLNTIKSRHRRGLVMLKDIISEQ